MKKKLIALALTLALMVGMATTASAYTTRQYRIAEAMNHLGLFLGGDNGYALDDLLGRDDGTTLLVRMLGKDAEAKAGGDFGMPFNDVPAWAKGYIGYAWKNKIVNGLGDGTGVHFGPDQDMTDYMFLTLTLRALGYSDSGENPQFVWNNPYDLAQSLGILTTTEPDKDFTRGEALEIFWRALDAQCYGENMTLSQRLIAQGVFTAAELAQARVIQKNGRDEIASPDEDDEESEPAPSTPAEPETPDPEPSTPVEPEDPEPGPSTPVEPEDPEPSPSTPVEPETPEPEPGTPVEPENPDSSGENPNIGNETPED